MARTKFPGRKRVILVRNVECRTRTERLQRAQPKLIFVKINSDVYLDSVKTSYAIGRLLHHMLPDLHLRSLHSLLDSLESAKELVAALLDKPSKQLAGVQKLIDNSRTKMAEREDMEYPETRSRIMSYITEHIMRYEGLGELHGFLEVTSKRR